MLSLTLGNAWKYWTQRLPYLSLPYTTIHPMHVVSVPHHGYWLHSECLTLRNTYLYLRSHDAIVIQESLAATSMDAFKFCFVHLIICYGARQQNRLALSVLLSDTLLVLI